MKFSEFKSAAVAALANGGMTGNALATATGANQSSAYRWLKQMVESGDLFIGDGGAYFLPSAQTAQTTLDLEPETQPVAVEVMAPETESEPEKKLEIESLATFAYKRMGNVRTATVNGEPWFCLLDICDVLLIANSRMVAKRLDPDEKGDVSLADAMGREQETTFINESGLYATLLRSDKPEAKPFRKWVTSEVLPSIRKTGSYSVNPEPPKPMSQWEMIAAMAQEAVKQEKRLEATERGLELVKSEVEELKQRRLNAEQELNKLPPASVPAVPKSTRAKVNERVAAYSSATGMAYPDIHSKLHKEFYYRHSINLHSRFMANRDKYKSKLDVVAELGLLEQYLAIAVEVLVIPGAEGEGNP